MGRIEKIVKPGEKNVVVLTGTGILAECGINTLFT